MGERRGGAWAWLARPWVYEAVQNLFGAEKGRRHFVACHLRPQPGERVLDIGCGTARLARLLGPVNYVGFEPNAEYVAQGRRENAGLDVTLHAGLFDEAAASSLGPFDLVVLSAVLHHLDDRTADVLLGRIARVLRPGGRLVTLDAVWAPGQNPLARALISLDRGGNVRDAAGYAGLAAPHFAEAAGQVSHVAWPPYTHWIMQCRLPRPRAAIT